MASILAVLRGFLELLDVQPVRSRGQVHLERHAQCKADSSGAVISWRTRGSNRLHLVGRCLEDQLIVDLQQHARLQALAAQPAQHVEHGQLDQVRGRALDLHVDRLALGLVALLIPSRPGSPPGRSAAAGPGSWSRSRCFAASFQQTRLILQHPRIAGEVGVDERLRLGSRECSAAGPGRKALMP